MVRVSEVKRNRTYSIIYRAIYAWLRRVEAGLLFTRYYLYFATHPSKLVAIWNGNKFYGAVAVLAAQALGRKPVFFEGGLLPGTTTIDDRGINYANSLPRDPAFYREWARKNQAKTMAGLPKQLIKREFIRNKKVIGSRQMLPRHYIFAPFQVNGDSQLFRHSPWIHNMHDFYIVLEHMLASLQDKSFKLVIKEHPSCPMNYRDLHLAAAENGRILFANVNETQELIENAQAVVTINSTVGLEALLLGKKVIVLGQACYALPQLVLSAQNEEELWEAMKNIMDWQPDNKLKTAFLSFVYHSYCIPGEWQEPAADHWRAAGKRVMRMVQNTEWLD